MTTVLLLLLLATKVLLLLLLTTVLLVGPRAVRSSTTHWVSSLVVWLAVLLLAVVLAGSLLVLARSLSVPSGQVDIHSSLVVFGVVLETHLLAHALDHWLDLLDVIDRVVALTDDTKGCQTVLAQTCTERGDLTREDVFVLCSLRI